MEARIIELETKISFQEQTIDSLNEALISQQRQLDKMERTLESFRGQILKLMHSTPEGDEKPPPHY